MRKCICCGKTFYDSDIPDTLSQWYYYQKFANTACSVICGLTLVHQDTHAKQIQKWYRTISRNWGKKQFSIDLKKRIIISHIDDKIFWLDNFTIKMM